MRIRRWLKAKGVMALALAGLMLVSSAAPMIAEPTTVYAADRRAEIEKSLYNEEYYAKANEDVAVALNGDPVALYNHWVNYGKKEGRNASMVFNAKYYLEKNPDVAAVVGEDYVAAYEHFVTSGLLEGRESSPVFSVKYYLQANTDVAAAFNNDYVMAAKHFNENAIAEGRSGSGNFDYTVYRSCNKDVEELYGEYIEGYYIHYINHGRAEGRTGGLAADGSGSTGSESGGTTGGGTGIDTTAPSYRIFDADYYLEQYPALEISVGTDADTLYKYWMNEGIALGQTASPVIVPEEYLELNQDVAEALGNDYAAAINHFLTDGIVEGRTGSYEFDYTIYVACNTDVTAEFGGENKVDYYFHYVKYGKAEDRTAAVYVPEAPEGEAEDWKTVLRALHSLETYEEREEYIAKLDKSAYKAEQTENYDLINKCNSAEEEVKLIWEDEVIIGYIGYDSNYEVVLEYAADELPEEYRGAIHDIYNEVDCEPVEIEGYGLCFFETQYGYPTEVQTVYADLRELIAAVHGIWYNEPCYLMTITNTATGETDPWGIMYDGVAVPIVYTIEEAVAVYESFDVRALNEYYVSVHGHKPAHIETWDTLKYYDDLVFWDVEENEYNKPWGYGKVAR